MAGSLIALKAFPYASGSVAAGEVFQPRSSFDAKVLIATRMATRMATRHDSVSDDDMSAPMGPDDVTPPRRKRRARQLDESE